jgi:hypothetical protein
MAGNSNFSAAPENIMSDENPSKTIYVALLDEGSPVWRPVEAIVLRDQIYQIVSENHNPDDERWEFTAGEIVRCVFKALIGDSRVLVAVESAMKNFMVVDGALNSTFDVFGTDEATFAVVFPDGADISFLDEVTKRVKDLGLDEAEFFGRLYSNRREKNGIRGLHGTLHSTGTPSDKGHFPTRRESDIARK